MDGVVLSGSNNLFSILCDDGVTRLCAIKGKRIKAGIDDYNALAAGDRVEIAFDTSLPDRGLVCALRKRRNVFGRFNEKGRSRQAIAANLDLVVCVTSPQYPPFRPRFVDRVAVLAEAAHVPLLIVLNKKDLGVDSGTEERLRVYASLGYGVEKCCATMREGIDALFNKISGLTSVFVGQSGVGKTSLLNALEPGLCRRTGEVSEKYDRGKHTTTMAEMLCLTDGSTRIVDTPGFRRLALRGIESYELDAYFPELAMLAPRCEFGLSCTHLDELGCAIRKSVLDGGIHEDRYESYLRIRSELDASSEYRRKEGWSVPSTRRGDGARKAARFHGDSGDGDDDERA